MNATAPAKSDSYDKYQAQDDLHTITRAKEIEKDKKRMANVRRAAKEKLAEMANLKTIAAGGAPK